MVWLARQKPMQEGNDELASLCRRIGRLRANRKERYLIYEEIQCLLAATSEDLHDIIIVGLGTGMRASEVLTLDRDHTDLKQAVAVLPDTKNHDRRVVPLPPPVVGVFQRRPVPLREWFPGWHLFRLVHTMHRTTREVGLKGVTFHTLRHTFASHAVMAGVDLHTLAKILGHRDLSMVQRYAHLAPAHLQAATNRAASAVFAGDVPRQVPQATASAAYADAFLRENTMAQ